MSTLKARVQKPLAFDPGVVSNIVVDIEGLKACKVRHRGKSLTSDGETFSYS